MERAKRTQWFFGEKVLFAKACGISSQYLCDILHGRKRALPELALVIEAQAAAFSLALDRNDVMYPATSKSPLIEVAK